MEEVEMTILPDHEIEELGNQGLINPYKPEQLQASSYDVRLHNTFQIFREIHTVAAIDPKDQAQNDRATEKITAYGGIYIHPHEFLLGSTHEYIKVPNDLVCRLEGKSSLGRLGLAVHVTAGYIDPGFEGNVTLEIFNVRPRPIILRPGMLIAQIGFAKMTSAARNPYKGRYQGNTEATPSRYGV